MVQSPLPPQLTVQSWGHEKVMSADDEVSTVQLPSGHEKSQSPLPLQLNSQPVVGHDREQSLEVTQ
jgi:hypothetical protein